MGVAMNNKLVIKWLYKFCDLDLPQATHLSVKDFDCVIGMLLGCILTALAVYWVAGVLL